MVNSLQPILFSWCQRAFLCNKYYADQHVNKLLANRATGNADKVGKELPGRIRKAIMPICSRVSSPAAIAMPTLRGLPFIKVNAALEDASWNEYLSFLLLSKE